MRLRPTDFKADPANAFDRDQLDRKGHVKALCRVISTIDDHGIITIDAPWGAGKTAFLKMTEAHLQSTGIRVVEFNAWLESYTQSPMVDLVSAIDRRLGTSLTEDIVTTLKTVTTALTRAGVRFVSHGYFDPDDMETGEPRVFDLWSEPESKVKDFTERLGKLATSGEGPIVVTIDELDRCRPAYALDLLDTVRHLFAIDGVVIVLAINRTELCHSIETIYGAEFNVDRYLRRFADLSIRLPAPKAIDLSRFLDGLLTTTGLSEQVKADSWSGHMLQILTTTTNCSLRDLEQAVHLILVTLASLDVPPGRSPRNESILQQAAVALIVLRFVDSDIYDKLTTGRIDPFDAVATINAAIPIRAENVASASDYIRAHDRLQALLLMGPAQGSDYEFLEPEEEAFAHRYVAAEAGDVNRAVKVFENRQGAFNANSGDPISIKSLARAIDLVEIDTS